MFSFRREATMPPRARSHDIPERIVMLAHHVAESDVVSAGLAVEGTVVHGDGLLMEYLDIGTIFKARSGIQRAIK
jgi:hypothetical protein